MGTIEFGEFMLKFIREAKITQAELARLSGISAAQVSRLFNGISKPGPDACKAFANALRIPTETVFRAAGILPNRPDTNEDFEELKHLFNQMTDEEQREFLAMGRLKIELRNKRGDAHDTPSARAVRVRT
jgi:transcriptional regulator with XRE-family HTH domain